MAEYIEPMKPIIEQIMTDFRIKEENHIMKAVADVGIVVDKDRLLQAMNDAQKFYKEGYRAAMSRPDVVEVVRCKDCKHYENHKLKIFENCVRDERCIPMSPNDFCSYGERKDGAE